MFQQILYHTETSIILGFWDSFKIQH